MSKRQKTKDAREAAGSKQATLGQAIARQQQNAVLEIDLCFEEQLTLPCMPEAVFHNDKVEYSKYIAKFGKEEPQDEEEAENGTNAALRPPRRRSERYKAYQKSIQGKEEVNAAEDARRERHADNFVSRMAALASANTVLPLEEQQALVTVVLNSDLHRGPQLSVRALEVLNATLAAHPVALLAPPDANGFTVLRRNEQLLWLRPDTPLMVGDVTLKGRNTGAPRRMSGFKALLGLVRCVLKRAEHPDETDYYGELLLLSYLAKQYQQDLVARVAAYRANAKALAAAAQAARAARDAAGAARAENGRKKAAAVLSHAMLARVLQQDYAPWTGERSKQALVSSLLLLIAQTSADASSGSGDSGGAPEGLLLGRPEIGALAAQLLQLLLLLYGACEEAKLYAGGSQATRSVTQLNDRVELDRVLLECLSHEAKLRQTGAHTAVLSCLPPRDRARLLGFYVAEAHANRHFVDDIAPELKLAHQYYEENRGRGSEGYYDVDPAVVLAYIAQHWEWARTRLFNGTEGILTLMSQLALAALQRPATAGGAAGLARLRELFLEVEGKLATLPGNACTKLCTQSPQVVAALQAVGSALGRAVAA